MKTIMQLFALGLILATTGVHADLGPVGMNQWQLIGSLSYCFKTNIDSVYSKLELLINENLSSVLNMLPGGIVTITASTTATLSLAPIIGIIGWHERF